MNHVHTDILIVDIVKFINGDTKYIFRNNTNI